MKTEFPIYHIDFTLFAGENELAGCTQDMMVLDEFTSHDAALVSLYRVMNILAEKLDVLDMVTSWSGSITLERYDMWCLHYKSHYTYRRFSSTEDALADFLIWARDHRDEVETDLEDWHVCLCNNCKRLNRTMILHSGEDGCDYSSVS